MRMAFWRLVKGSNMNKKTYWGRRLQKAQEKASYFMAMANDKTIFGPLRKDAERAAKQWAEQIGRFLPLVKNVT